MDLDFGYTLSMQLLRYLIARRSMHASMRECRYAYQQNEWQAGGQPTIGLKLVVGDRADRVLGELALVVVRRGSTGRQILCGDGVVALYGLFMDGVSWLECLDGQRSRLGEEWRKNRLKWSSDEVMDKTRPRVVLDFSWRGGVDLDFSVSFRGLSPCAAERGWGGKQTFFGYFGEGFWTLGWLGLCGDLELGMNPNQNSNSKYCQTKKAICWFY